MYKRLSYLPGLAILAVILNHAGGWGYVAMVWWAHRYRDVVVPAYDQIFQPGNIALDAVHNLTIFAVGAFLFVSGFFIAYTARGNESRVGWKTIRPRIVNLLIPYVIWSIFVFLLDAFFGDIYTPGNYLLKFFLIGANGGYFFVPVLVMFYLISPWIVDLAKKNARFLIIIALLIQLLPIALRYIRLFFPDLSFVNALINLTPDQLIFRWALYFPLGVVFSVKMNDVKQWLQKYRSWVLTTLILSFLLYTIEAELVIYSTPDHWKPGPSSIFFLTYTVSLIFAFLAFEELKIPYASQLTKLGGRSYGIYLVHFEIMTIAAKLIYHFLPQLLSSRALLTLVLFAIGLGGSLLVIWFVQKTPLSRFYRYLFG